MDAKHHFFKIAMQEYKKEYGW